MVARKSKFGSIQEERFFQFLELLGKEAQKSEEQKRTNIMMALDQVVEYVDSLNDTQANACLAPFGN